MEVVKVLYNGVGTVTQDYSLKDDLLITSNFINNTFGSDPDTVEYSISDELGTQLYYEYNHTEYKKDFNSEVSGSLYTAIFLDPENDVKRVGFGRGITYIQYNFNRNLFNSSFTKRYFIKEISTSRTELKLSSQQISGEEMNTGTQAFQQYISQRNYYGDFYLNFGNNNLIIAVNAAYANDGVNSFVLIKLYEPLPLDFDIKDTLWIVDKIGDSASYEVNIQVEAQVDDTENKLRGPNYNVKVTETVGQTTPYYSYVSLFSSPISSSMQQLASYYDDKAIRINVDYSNFSNFIHFSSAIERVNNFVYKLRLIETYQQQISNQFSIAGSGITTVISSSVNVIQSKINSIVEKFDNYEYYLYYQSESFAWPKTTSTKPYQLYSVTSSQALNWLGSEMTLPSAGAPSILYSASFYDKTNKDILSAVAIPQYIVDDPSNAPYISFIDMVGQHFDNIWVYYKDVTNRYRNANDPNTGISLDLVEEALKGLGVSLYTNTNLSDNVYYSLLGYNQDGSLLPPTGSEKNITYVTSSLATLPYNDIQKEIYKRIYHNLPYLLKARGTERGVKALISCYGIPESLLSPMEFGGYDRFDHIGVIEENTSKITIISGSTELSQSILSPYSTLQYFDNDNRLNSLDVEVAFSPSNTINTNISQSIGYFSIDNLIGNPMDQYSSSYSALDRYRDNYFQSYNQSHSVSEYIRLLKFYNNSLFKMVKDFVPARSSVSTGIVIKPHMLERSKYARHEPSMSVGIFTQSIQLLEITGSTGTDFPADTTSYKIVPTNIGYVPITSSFGFEKYTGEFDGTDIVVSNLNTINDQSEISKNAALTASSPSSDYLFTFENQPFVNINSLPYVNTIRVNYGATYQNVTNAVRSQKYLDLDYSSNANVPVNFGIITSSIDRAIINNYATYTDPNTPYAQLQDFNYTSQRSTIPRYYGSQLRGLYYNTFSTASDSYLGDVSYGVNPVIERRSKKIALFTQITDSPFFTGKVNATLAYLVDATSGLYELNLENKNWFEVQNIFKSGKNLTIKQFDNKKYSNQKNTDGVKYIVESGFNYSPILYFGGADSKIYFDFSTPPQAVLNATNNGAHQISMGLNRFISGSSVAPSYPFVPTGVARSSSMYDIFNVSTRDDAASYTPGNRAAALFPTYSVRFAGDYSINSLFNIDYEVSSSFESGSITFQILKNGVVQSTQRRLFFTAVNPPGTPWTSLTNYQVIMQRTSSVTNVFVPGDNIGEGTFEPREYCDHAFYINYIGPRNAQNQFPGSNITASITIKFANDFTQPWMLDKDVTYDSSPTAQPAYVSSSRGAADPVYVSSDTVEATLNFYSSGSTSVFARHIRTNLYTAGQTHGWTAAPSLLAGRDSRVLGAADSPRRWDLSTT
jgi:hypothetical protein